MNTNVSTENNILLGNIEHIPFDKIKNDHFIPAIEESIKLSENNIAMIINNKEKATFRNTIEGLEFATRKLDEVFNLLNNKNRCYTDEETQKICKEASDKMTVFKNNLYTNSKLFERVSEVFENKDNLNLTKEQKTLLNKKHYTLIRNGAQLDDKNKERLCEINVEISRSILQFEENLLAEKKAFILNITNEHDLKGLPDGPKEAAKKLANNKNVEGWVFTFDIPSYLPFMTYIENRELRKKFSLAYGARCYNDSQYDNKELVLKIAKLRLEKAKLLGFYSHADFVLDDRMANKPEKVFSFINKLRDIAKVKAEDEIKELSQLAKDHDGIDVLQKWDSTYYSEKLKKKLYDLDEEEIRPYFKLENVLNGVFYVANKLYGISFKEVDYLSKFNSEVKTFEVLNPNGEIFAYFYGDFFPRDDKQNGGWVYTFNPQYKSDYTNENRKPYVGIFCNFPRPTETKPSLLSFSDVNTLFHEFGHALHSMFSEVSYPSLSNINVLWDFVELPSQIMENFTYEIDVLKSFAYHYQTNELLPIEKIEKIKNAKNFLTGLSTIRQSNFSYLDMKWHYDNFPTKPNQIKEFEEENSIEFYPSIKENCNIVSFLHLFNSTYDYSAGYYSYHWAEVLDADAFEVFKDKGILNNNVGSEFKNKILKKGGTEDPLEIYKDFRGKDPSIDAFLKRKGLL